MQQQQQAPCDGGVIVYDAKRFQQVPEDLFDPHQLSVQGMLDSFGSGRGTVWLFHYGDEGYALRHYRRGGKVALLWEDRYVYSGAVRTRPVREAAILQFLLAQGFPTATPVAWRVQRSGVMYRADLISTRIIKAVSLVQLLTQRAMPHEDWRRLGGLLRRMHDLKIWHADLNLGNILWRETDGFHLIDFDRSRRRRGNFWKRGNLLRLRRSCFKEQQRHEQFYFADDDFAALFEGYSGNTP